MISKLKPLLFLLVFALFSCKNESSSSLSEYKFSDKGIVLNCDDIDSKLINEALFAFEEDIDSYYRKTSPNQNANANMVVGYSQFIRDAISGRAKYANIVTPHTVEVFKVLQTKKDLWNLNNTVSKLNYNSNFFNCLANNIQDKNLKTTLNALITTNSMSPKLFGAPLSTKYRAALNDKYLAAYMAFDLFYAKLFEIDLTQVKEREPEKVDFNKIPQIPQN